LARFARSDGGRLALVLFVALALRAYAWSQTAVLFNDGPIFLALAEAIGEGRWAEVLAHPYHPLYPGLIALVSAFSVDRETAAVVVSIAGGLLSVAAVFWFVRDVFGRDVAWLAAWMVALHPWAVDFSSDVMSDGLYTGIFLLGFALMVRVVGRPTWKTAAACGVVFGLAFLTRPEGAGLFLACLVLLSLRAIRLPESRRAATVSGIALLVAGSIVLAPFVIFVSGLTGEFTVTQKKSLSRLIADPASPSVRAEKRLEGDRLRALVRGLPLPEQAIRADGRGASRPDRNLAGVVEAVVRVAQTSMSAFRWELLLLALVGIFAARSNSRRDQAAETERPDGGRRRGDQATALVAAGYMGLLILLVWGAGYVSRRHALPPWLPLLAYSALGVEFLWRSLAARFVNRDAPLLRRLQDSRVVCLVLVAALVLGWGARDLRSRRDDRIPVRVAAEWLAENRKGTGPVAAQKLRVAYYAAARFVPLPAGHDGRIEDHLRRRGARWVVIDRAKLGDHLGLEEGMGQWLRVVHTTSARDKRIFVLSVEPKPAS